MDPVSPTERVGPERKALRRLGQELTGRGQQMFQTEMTIDECSRLDELEWNGFIWEAVPQKY